MNESDNSPQRRAWPLQAVTPETDWVRAELHVRAAAVASLSEAEFIRRLRTAGIAMWAREYTADGSASGFVIETPIGSGRTRCDGEIAPDLALGVLREQWERGDLAHTQAFGEWRGLHSPGVFDRDRILLSHPAMWSRMFSDAGRFNQDLRSAPVRADSEWGWAAARLAGAFAAWSLRVEPQAVGPFAAAAHELGRSARSLTAGADALVIRRRLVRANLSRVAFGLAQLDHDDAGDPADRSLLLVIQLSAGVIAIGKAHRRRGELSRAQALAEVGASLHVVCRELHARTHTSPPDHGAGGR
ncbi:hypothetical protein [Nocardia sp. NPDC050710]|uniref:hypothetical protein n=1 Tax=Nocardia sp. NPDC050710 TaxID=3157220 RepID=UPI0033F5B920